MPRTVTLSIPALLCLAACAGSEPAAPRAAAQDSGFAPADAAAEQSDCFNARSINGFSEVDRDTVRLRVGQDRYTTSP